jgi:TRAP-type mannitol/chloroaromatic compound transport system permease large subunit
MENEPAKSDTKTETPHESVAKTAATIGGAACVTMIVGAFLGAAWPAAVVGCALCLMGVGVAYIMLRGRP